MRKILSYIFDGYYLQFLLGCATMYVAITYNVYAGVGIGALSGFIGYFQNPSPR